MKKHIMKILLILIIVYTGCKDDPPVVPLPPEPKATLTQQDVSCLEAWIKLEFENIELPVNVSLLKDSILLLEINNLTSSNTIVYIDSLQPNQTYKFQSIIQPINQSDEVKSNELQVTTLAPTSQSFMWQVYSWGMHSSSEIRDIAIIDENNIWCVGEIYMNDSFGQLDTQPYAVAHWDGLNWHFMKVPYHDFNQTTKHPGPLFSIDCIDDNIYVVSYANFLKWTGSDWEEIAFFMKQIPFDSQILKVWGFDKNNIYCVGRNGAIYIYFGSDWQKLEKKTELDIYDILGQKTGNGGYEIICVAAKPGISNNKKIYKIENNAIVELPSAGIPSSIKGLWFKSSNKYYVVGSGIFTKQNISSNFGWEPIWQGLTEYYTGSIDGNDINDIIICGAYGEMLHYNGSTWRSYREEIGRQTASYGRVKIEGDLVVAVGQDHPKALITIGRR